MYMYFEPLISVKCCPKLQSKQLRNNLHYICLRDRVGWGETDEKGGSRKGPPDPPLDTSVVQNDLLRLEEKCVFSHFLPLSGD